MKINAKKIKQDISDLKVGVKLHVTPLSEADVKYVRQICSNVRKDEGYYLKCSLYGKGVMVERLQDETDLGKQLGSMVSGEVKHYDKSKYDTLRAYSAKSGIKVRTVVEVIKI